MSPPSTHRLITPGTHTGLVVMGVSGAGKSTVSRLLADRLGWALAEADGPGVDSAVERVVVDRGEITLVVRR